MSVRSVGAVLASLKFTLVIFVFFTLSVGVVYFTKGPPAWILAVPFTLFAVNLTAAILTNPVFRRQTGLLVFHLGLLGLVLLLAASRLSYLKGHLEVTEGEAFTGQLTEYEKGPLHPWHLEEARFVQKSFTIDYAPGLNRGRTLSRVEWLDEKGQAHERIVGDHHPLVLSGYRFYTTHNKGFAPIFVWHPADGSPPRQGSIHLPSYPAHEYQQALSWTVPGTRHEIWSLLEFKEVVLDEKRASTFRPPREHHLVLRYNDERHVIKAGESLQFPDGRLHYLGLRAWMGYAVFYDWTTPWLLAACVVAVLGLGWHYRQKWAARPWSGDDEID